MLYGVVKDEADPALQKLTQAYEEQTVILVSGGSSVGDHTAEIINKMGAPGLVFHGLAVQPGNPPSAASWVGSRSLGCRGIRRPP